MFQQGNSENWETFTLENIDNVNYYQFCIQEKHENIVDPVEPDNPGQPGGEPIADLTYDVDFGQASWNVFGETITASVNGKVINNGEITQIKGDEVIKLSNNFDPRLMQAVVKTIEPGIEENNWFTARLAVNENYETSLETVNVGNLPNDKPLKFVVEEYVDDGPEMPELPEGNTDTTFTISSDAEHTGSYVEGLVRINGYEVQLQAPEGYQEGDPIPASAQGNVRYMYDNEEKVTLTFESLFIKKYVGTIIVNGEEYNVEDYIDYTDRTDWLDHYGRQCLAFDIDVDYAESYNVVMNLEDQEGKDQYIGNFLWTIDPRAEGTDEYIGHSRLELVKVTYWMNLGPDEDEITVTAENIDQDPYIEYDPDGMVGSLVVPEGALCTMRIIPDYGYQVTSFGINGNDIIAGEEISEFSFPIHKGNFHLCAKVNEVNNTVDAKSEKVKAGEIEIGGNEIDSGSVVLTVNDIEPSEAKIEKFEEAAGEYKISSYLDIDLDKVIYKGTAEDVWSERIHELRDEATITLQLEEGVDGNDIIIVHNIDDGDEYEVIEITSYDPETNTVTFKTKSFSNYAIASKTTKEEVYTVTSDNIILVFTDLEGHEFEATIVDVMSLTDKQLEEFGITKEEYEKAKEIISKGVKDYGTLLAVYNILIEDGNYEHTGKAAIKIKMTEEMKKYSKFKLVNINEEDFSAGDVVELEVDGEYLVGTLKHLSVYALVADTEKTANPTTGDVIAKYIVIFAIASIGLITVKKISSKKRK